MSPDAILKVMVALIFLSGLLFAAHLGIDALRTRTRAARDDDERRRAAIVKVALVVAGAFMVAALSVVVWMIRG